MATKPPRFRRADAERGDGEDTVGRVRVYVRMIDPDTGAVLKGSISRTVTLTDAKVSDVADVIDRALFGKSRG